MQVKTNKVVLCWLRRPRLCPLRSFGAEQGDSDHGGSELHGTKEGERRLEAQRQRRSEEEASKPKPGEEHEDVQPHGLPTALSAKDGDNASEQRLRHVIAE
jgi:hypothetical protein